MLLEKSIAIKYYSIAAPSGAVFICVEFPLLPDLRRSDDFQAGTFKYRGGASASDPKATFTKMSDFNSRIAVCE